MAKAFWDQPGAFLSARPRAHRRPVSSSLLHIETLEERRLLSGSEPFFKFNIVRFGGVAYILSVSGPGEVKTQTCGNRSVSIKLVGTTQDSQLTISAIASRTHSATTPLSVKRIEVRSGRLGSIQGLTSTDLEGPISTLQGPVTSLQLDAIGPKAQISIISGNSAQPSVNGNLGQLTVNRGIDLGPTGFIDVANDLTGSLSVSTNLTLNGGQISIGRDLSGTVTIGGNLTINDGSKFSVARNLGSAAASSASATPASTTAGATTSPTTATAAAPSAGGGVTVTGSVALDDGSLTAGGNAGSFTVGGNLEASSGGGISVAGNLTSLTVNAGSSVSNTGNLNLNPNGLISVGGNLTTLTTGSSIQLFTGSQIAVTGNLSSLTVGGNLQTSFGGAIHVTGNLGTVSVTGVVQGKGPGGGSDITVGDDLAQLTVLGGGDGVQGLQGVNLSVTSNIQGVDIRNGIANSLIQAGYLINGGTPGTGSNAWNIGPDGASAPSSVDPDMGQIAVLNSTIQAGYEIMNMTIGGDVVSDRPSNPSAGVTRIVAGETLGGQIVPNGVLDTFQIIGNLVNAVLAASVGPNPQTGYYDQPAGAIEVGFLSASSSSLPQTSTSSPTVVTNGAGTTQVGLQVANTPGTPSNPVQTAQLQNSPVPIFTGPPFVNPTDPELPAVSPGGQINPTFAPKLQVLPPVAPSATQLPLPSKTTVVGSVITTAPGKANTDYAGIFAANTNGVLVGPVPTSPPVSPAP